MNGMQNKDRVLGYFELRTPHWDKFGIHLVYNLEYLIPGNSADSLTMMSRLTYSGRPENAGKHLQTFEYANHFCVYDTKLVDD